MNHKLLFLTLLVFLITLPFVLSENTTVKVFYSPSCPHCHAEMEYLSELKEQHPEIILEEYAVWAGVRENDRLFEQMAKEYSTTYASVPKTFIDNKAFVGFSEQNGPLQKHDGAYIGYKNQIEKAILEQLGKYVEPEKEEYGSITQGFFYILALPILFFICFYFVFRKKIHIRKRYWLAILIILAVICVFIFTKSFPVEHLVEQTKHLPFPIFTFIIAFFDGFNPCAMFVLTFLLALLVYTGSKRKMALIGLVFILTSGFMYFIYMLVVIGILNTPLFESNKFILRMVVGAIALIAAAINIKDFFAFKKGISLTIPEEQRHRIIARMRNIVYEIKEAQTRKAVLIAVIATIILAAIVNLIELACTLMLPLIYGTVLSQNIPSFTTQVLYTILYNIIYVIPLFAIFGAFLYTFKTARMTQTQGRILKLVGGILMLILGLIMLLRPEILMLG
jgi:thiol-disulfide isomerase/thioredoxin